MMIKKAKMTNLSKGLVAGLGVTAIGGAGVSVYDAFKSRDYPYGDFSDVIKDNATSVKKQLAKKDTRVQLLDGPKSIDSYRLRSLEPVVGKLPSRMLASTLKEITRSGSNAAALAPGKDKDDAIVSTPMANPVVIDHELGHIKDFRKIREEGGSMQEAYGGTGIGRGLLRGLSKDVFDADIIAREKAAWDYVEDGERKKKVMVPAMNSYHHGFHQSRSVMAGAAGGASATLLSLVALAKGKPSNIHLAPGYLATLGGGLAGATLAAIASGKREA